MSAALVDTGPIVAVFGERQKQTTHYRHLFERANAERWVLSTTWPCIAEASHLLAPARRYAMLRWVAAGAVSVFPFDQEILDPMVNLMRRYTEVPRTQMDLADASLVWLASDTGIATILTTDLRDFSRYRLADGRSFEIL